MEMRMCKKCGNEYPMTIEYFYCWTPVGRNIIQWCSYCRACDRERVRIKNNRKYIHKLSQPSPKQIIASRQPLMRTCKRCGTPLELNKENFYYKADLNKYEKVCLECRREAARYRYDMKNDIEMNELPGQFTNEEEKQAVFDIMKRMGWKFSNKYQRWYKEPLKNRQNVWRFPKKTA